jgi:hypothetical protein
MDRKQCPICGTYDIHQASLGDGSLGDWCPVCKKPFQQIMEEVADKMKGLLPYCPNCMIKKEANQYICKCGYNYLQPNIDKINSIIKKRFRNNILSGVLMIIFGIGYLALRWPSDIAQINKGGANLSYGIAGLLIIFGIFKLLTAEALKAPTKSPFDYILGNSRGKDINEDISYFHC